MIKIVHSTDVRGALQARARGQSLHRQRGFFTLPGGMGGNRPSSGGGGGGDPDFALRRLLVHNEGGSIVDSSSYGRTLTPSGAAQSTDWAYFGTQSCKNATAGGNQNRVIAAHDASLDPGANEYTIEFAFRLTAVGVTQVLFGKAAGTGVFPFQIIVTAADKLVFRGFDSGSNMASRESATTLVANTTYWLQCRRRNAGSPTFAAYMEIGINGVQDDTAIGSSVWNSSTAAFSNTGPLYIGNFDSGAQFPFIGYWDMLRYTIGKAEAFALPSAAFPTF